MCKDYSNAFSAALKVEKSNQTMAQKKMKDYLLHQLMFCKPYSGKIRNRNTEKNSKKCFTDECEWRYVPDVTIAGYRQVYYDDRIINSGGLNEISNSMFGVPEISLEFDYSDLKYIIVKTEEDFRQIAEAFTLLDNLHKERELVSKLIIWDSSRGDF